MRTEFLCISVLRVASGLRVKLALCLTLCNFVLVFFSPFSIAITSLGEERAILSAFRTFVRFAPVWFCLFPLPLGVWEGLRFVIVALPGLFLTFLFSYGICFATIRSSSIFLWVPREGCASCMWHFLRCLHLYIFMQRNTNKRNIQIRDGLNAMYKYSHVNLFT